MQPGFVGSVDHRLFYVYHPPSVHNENSQNILICSPIGQEYMRSYRMIRQLAEQLANAGHHVMRFDWYGYGDSSGKCEEGSIEIWIEDISIVLENLVNRSKRKEVALIGLRLGASIIWKYVMQNSNVKSIVLWEPVINGKQWIKDLKKQHALFLERIAAKSADVSEGQYLGFSYSTLLQNEIEKIDLANDLFPSHCKINLISSDISTERNQFENVLKTFHSHGTIQTIEQYCLWDDVREFERVILKNPAIPLIVNSVSEQK